ncbi:MAG TPA: hypothetical protein VLC47_01060 [Burkholderiales bacterium]|nr:hypothetical protein [Burkholderiales bacterium]
MARSTLLAFAIATAFASYDALAARPFNTDDARIVDPGGYQVEAYVKDQRGIKETEYWILPAVNFAARSTASSSRWAGT